MVIWGNIVVYVWTRISVCPWTMSVCFLTPCVRMLTPSPLWAMFVWFCGPLREDAHAVATLGNVRLVFDPLREDAHAVATLGRAKTLLLSPTRFDHKGSSYRCAVQPLALGEA